MTCGRACVSPALRSPLRVAEREQASEQKKSGWVRYCLEAGALGELRGRRDRAVDAVLEKAQELSVSMEKMKIAEYVELLDRPLKLMYVNFLAGLARGVGSAVGWAILAAVLVGALRHLVRANLPLMGGFIADLVRLVQSQLAR